MPLLRFRTMVVVKSDTEDKMFERLTDAFAIFYVLLMAAGVGIGVPALFIYEISQGRVPGPLLWVACILCGGWLILVYVGLSRLAKNRKK